MAPIPPPPPLVGGPKVILYHQTHHTPAGEPVSVLPLLRRDGDAGVVRPSATHVIVGAIHLNADPAAPTLNDHHPDHARFDVLWAEVRVLQQAGVRVLGMLGGAAKGSFARLDVGDDVESRSRESHHESHHKSRRGVSPAAFEAHYAALHDLVRRRRLDGLDLDVEEAMSLAGAIHLIDRLRADFGPRFLLTLAPVAATLLRPEDPRCNLSGFSYADLEARRGRDIAWYHAQFYCGWGDASQPDMYLAMTAGAAAPIAGLAPHRVVMGLVTNPANGPGWVALDRSADVLLQLLAAAQNRSSYFAGVSGWEYFNSLPGAQPRPWEWAEWMSAILGSSVDVANVDGGPPAAAAPAPAITSTEADPDEEAGPEAPVPTDFEYKSDTED